MDTNDQFAIRQIAIDRVDSVFDKNHVVVKLLVIWFAVS